MIARSKCLPLIGLLAVGPFALPVHATNTLVVCVQNIAGVPASDLHVTFSGAGGNLYVDPLSVVAVGCPTPTVPSNGTVTNSAYIDWGPLPCVGPGASVVFIAYTTNNGPLAVTSGYWSTNGTNIGPISFCPGPASPPKPLPPGGGGRWGALKLEIWCAPDTPGFYLGCFKQPFGICWEWWCCIPAGHYYWRLIWCPFASPLFRFFEVPPWFVLTPWVKDGAFGAKYRWVKWTLPVPPPLPPPFGPQGPPPTNGPPPFGPPKSQYPYPPQFFSFDVRYSDDAGVTFRKGSDFIQSFFDIFTALDVTKPDTNSTFGATFPGILMEYGPRYSNAATVLGPLITELQRVATNPPNSTVSNLVIDTELLQLSLTSVSTQFVTGLVGFNPAPYQNTAFALSNMSLHISQLGLEMGLPRLFDVAGDLQAISSGFWYAAAVVTNGLVDSDVRLQHNFYWGLQNRAWPEWRQAASAAAPHVRVDVPINNWAWARSTIEPVHVKLQDRNTREILEDFYVPLSEGSFFDVFYLLPENQPVNLWFKLPTHLSQVIVTNLQDGLSLLATSPTPGDANGDNCVDSGDLQAVQLALGTGGSNAVSVSSSDVNGDGAVNTLDLSIVSANLGRCGQELPPPLLKSTFDGSLLHLFYPFDFQLQSTSTLPSSNWTTVALQPEVLGASYHLSLSPTGAMQFLRAKKSQ